jgi:hypothetical protein
MVRSRTKRDLNVSSVEVKVSRSRFVLVSLSSHAIPSQANVNLSVELSTSHVTKFTEFPIDFTNSNHEVKEHLPVLAGQRPFTRK